ncbi:tripartite tricarboxylate transporter TctB family protein [Falsirhodobacter xinxiangensis]|uniref:tripartite tricarboxylate transporter TctB family protein n=1 Tax=Falsirhodobacter xinxiangensis TaxID=2530049 RepID=UPI0010AAEA79|nr:tripartite tricarboxylate transporter TctB family protein [Rhodobacter xinxiangensis]
MMRIRNPKDFWLGLFYVTLGLGAAFVARGYRMGSGSSMGPGYFPFYIACLLVLVGAISIGRSAVRVGLAVPQIDIRSTVLVTASIVLFGVLLERAGLLIALVVCLLTAASASHRFRVEPIPALGLVAFVAMAAVVFVKGLGLSMPLVGNWFG